MANKADIKDKKTLLYKITDSNETKISLRKISDAKTDTSSFKLTDSEEDKENLCEVTSHNKTDKKKNKKKRRNKTTYDNEEKANCEAGEPSNEASEKKTKDSKIEDPKVSIYEVRNSDGKDIVVKTLSQTDIAKIIRDGSSSYKPGKPVYDVHNYDENLDKDLDKEVTIYNVIRKPGTNESEVIIKKKFLHKETSDEANKSEVAVKEQSLHKKTTSDEANESEVSVKEKSFDEQAISNKQNNVCPFTIEDDILIGVKDTIYNLHVGNLILQAFNAEPTFIGQVDATSGEQITFQQMKENSVKCALWLQKILGDKNKNKNNTYDEIITICTRDPMIAYIPYLATLYLGAMINPWKEEYFKSDVRISYFLEQNLPNVFFVDDHNVQKLQNAVNILKQYDSRIDPIIVVFGEVEGFYSLKTILATEVDKKIIDEFSCENCYNQFDTAIVMYSSNTVNYPGETQIPYLAFVSSSNLEVPLMTYGEIGMWYGCLCWTHSLFLTVRAIISFTTAVKIPTSLFNEQHVYEMIEKYKVTWMFLESSMCEKMFLTDIMMSRYNTSSLKQFLFGDTPINEGIHEDFVVYLSHVSITQVYCDSMVGVIAFQRNSGNLRSSGYVSKNVKVAIIDMDTRKVVGANMRGEIWCKTPYMYETISMFQKSDPKMDSQFNDWYCTGDFGYYDEEGDIYIVDKVKHLIRYKNWIVSPSEIEEMLSQDWNVAEAVVLPIPVPNDGQHPAAFVKKVSGSEVTEQELIVHIENTMEDCYKLRGGVYFVEDFKRLPNGKIDRSRVKFDAGWQILNKMIKEAEKSKMNRPMIKISL